MAQSKKQLDNLKRGNPDTQFVSGREAVENGRKGRKQRSEKRKRRKSLQETAQLVAKLPLNDLGVNRLKRNGVNIDDVDPDDVVMQLGIVIGIAGAAADGDARAAKVFEDWLENAERHKREQADLEKKKQEIEKLKAEIERLKEGSSSGDDDQVLLFIEGMKRGPSDTETDRVSE